MSRFVLPTVGLVFLTTAMVASPVSAQSEIAETTQVSVASDGTHANNASDSPAISGDGRMIVYVSVADNLVGGDTNNVWDVFLYEVASGTTTLVSVAPAGSQANGSSGGPAISADGGIVVYSSSASNLVDGDTNGVSDVFAFDVANGTTRRVSVATDGSEANAGSTGPAVSADGGVVVYSSSASNLVDGDTNGVSDVFAFDVASGTTTRISVAFDGTQSSGGTTSPDISADGSTIVYWSYADNLVARDTNRIGDIFVHDVVTGTTKLVSVSSNGTQVYEAVRLPAISGDGQTVVYHSHASNLVDRDTNNTFDVFAYDVATAATIRVSIAADGTQGDDRSIDPDVSADGQTIVFSSEAANLVAGHRNSDWDIFAVPLSQADTYNPFDDDDGSIFEDDIEWLYASGVTDGCGTRLFCPKKVVSRGQMAAFLRRALELPASSQDYFTDDETSSFEEDINRLAESGITKGCGSANFCPGVAVTRGHMAAFLVRAFGYTDDGGGNLFADDDASIFEEDIDKLATARITLGCNPPANTNYCPIDPVTREQMAAFLHRALD